MSWSGHIFLIPFINVSQMPLLFCFCFNHFSEDGVDANHSVTCSSGWLRMTLDCSRIAKEIAIVKDFLSKEGGRRCFILVSDKNKKSQKNLRGKLN